MDYAFESDAFESDAHSDINDEPVNIQTTQHPNVNKRIYQMFILA